MKSIPMKQIAILIFTAFLAIQSTYAQRETFTRKPIKEDVLLILLLEKGEVALSNEVLFKYDSTNFSGKNADIQLKALAAVMKHPKLKGSRFSIEGHTCDLGEKDYNQDLSERRAAKVLGSLIKNGAAKKRLSSIGYGETRPLKEQTVSKKDTSKVRTKKREANRRVVIRRIK